jgi:SAM-dependent methyltransferase
VYLTDTPANAPVGNPTIARDRKRWTIFRNRNAEYLAQHLPAFPDRARFLDLGTGPNQFADLTNRFRDAIRTDYQPYADVNVVADVSTRLPFANDAFDIVLATNFLEHVAEPARLTNEIYRVLTPGGCSIGIVPFLVGVHQRPHDFFRYTDIQLHAMLEKAGFTDISISPIGTPRDVYRQITRQYFQLLIGETPYPKKWLAKGLWTLQRCLSAAQNLSTNNTNFTLGYGWIAKKTIGISVT